MSVNALVLRTAGTNCDAETVHALKICGTKVDLIHLSKILGSPAKLARYSVLVIPGGFSYGDDIAAGKIMANELKFRMGRELRNFVLQKKLVIGICNGFQVLVKAGFLPANDNGDLVQTATFTQNDSGMFQCEWISLQKEKSAALWLNDLPAHFQLPIAHGEGKFVAKDNGVLRRMEKNRQVIFRYEGKNPNGSARSIAGICNLAGNVVGLMPHPERYVTRYQHPAWTRRRFSGTAPGLLFWQCAVRYARGLK